MTDKVACCTVDMNFFDECKHCFEATVDVNASAAAIFDCFEDAEAWPKWAGPIQRVEWTSPKPFGVGTTRNVHMSGDLVGYEVFIAWERGERMAFCFTHASSSVIVAFAEDYQVTPLPEGGCRVTWRMAMENKGVSALLMPVTGVFMRMMLKRWLKNFKKLVESEYTG